MEVVDVNFANSRCQHKISLAESDSGELGYLAFFSLFSEKAKKERSRESELLGRGPIMR